MVDRERDGYVLTTDKDRVDVDTVHRWLSEDAYWALGRPREVVEATIRSCDVWSVLAPDGAQVAFTRAVTDGLTFAWLCDVYVDPAHRGRGLATWLAGAAVEDLRERKLDRLVLATSDAHAVYRRVGFVVPPRPDKYMELELKASP
ncbi:MAG TPA: GNAT family N-acetyltransferase [Kineosporiaceae bacterium]|jgi:GNAT superfamily N-acetyltransferase|nr:GNAT family N-acetyltransferase [Kineosporiaceae bacterium]